MEQFIPFFIFIIIIAILIGFISYFVFKRLKGDLEIKIPKIVYNSDENITGQLKFKAKKPIQSNKFIISLIKEEYVQHGKSGSWVQRFKVDELIENKRNYGRNYSNYYDFSFEIDESQVGNLKESSIFGFKFKRNIRWRLYARIDAKGIDLTTQKVIKINKINSNL